MKKLLIVVGAGGSIELGMPSVREIDKLFDNWASENYSLNSHESGNLYRWVKEEVEKYYLTQGNSQTLEQNFESILYIIQFLSSMSNTLHRDYKNDKGLKAFFKIKEFPEIKRYFEKTVMPDADDFKQLQSYLVDKLLHHIRKKCRELELNKGSELSKVRAFFEILKEEFEIGFINLNYDNVILKTLPDLFTGFDVDTGKFDKNQFYHDNWNFCYHIHGSVHFTMNGKGVKMHEITWNNSLDMNFEDRSSQRNVNYTSEGNYFLNSTIITGLDKSNQILREPFRQYYMKIDKLIHDSDAILFIGYGFSDLHLNQLFPSHRMESTKKRQVVVIDYFPDETEAMYKRPDSWSYRLFETIPFNGDEMGNGSICLPPDTIIDYKKNNSFEFSRNKKYPLSIWYNGFLAACDNAEIIKEELKK
ncbi:SIR2-like domain-containing protein [Flavobacterium glycines]|uniref:SIR2-like domain-containing protein n=1 Tax=Flavobacterium glycines TaxID=551990 RepID=A0A1B9DSZ3_9FLAO|nr:SIR2 family protein [Flavobacterium glycines]OCB72786.1 hypothetical protein FBGL_05560 [Flavobacterium glycines]GEL11727.1 hypothetical protein FGL01_24660 [Flavobacterium glycines]SDJ84722.1 SIR2-like domain-containing protein [Flavobacterium glycines]